MATIPTTVIRHHKEKVRKCSLRFLHDRPEMTFLRQRDGFTFDATGFTLLAVDAPPLGPADAGRPLLLLDSTWRWLPQLLACVRGSPIARSIPGPLHTAYPRTSKVFEDPVAGLASIEALYVARAILGDDDPSLLDGYHWKEPFLASLRAARGQ
ncbi:MAG: hypothetical protein JNL08_19535 [Planctomycetes bacterium]|nr:hypothetical protein [Planctomycetota bacterium]